MAPKARRIPSAIILITDCEVQVLNLWASTPSSFVFSKTISLIVITREALGAVKCNQSRLFRINATLLKIILKDVIC
jgi:hypothetical protein